MNFAANMRDSVESWNKARLHDHRNAESMGPRERWLGQFTSPLSLFQALCSLTEASDYTPFTFSRLSSLPGRLESSFYLEASWGLGGRLCSPEQHRGQLQWWVTPRQDPQLGTTIPTADPLQLPVCHLGGWCLLGKQMKYLSLPLKTHSHQWRPCMFMLPHFLLEADTALCSFCISMLSWRNVTCFLFGMLSEAETNKHRTIAFCNWAHKNVTACALPTPFPLAIWNRSDIGDISHKTNFQHSLRVKNNEQPELGDVHKFPKLKWAAVRQPMISIWSGTLSRFFPSKLFSESTHENTHDNCNCG